MGPLRLALMLTASLALIASSAGAITLELVPVGDPGNAPDTAANCRALPNCGSVPYEYFIGKYEVTTSQYVAFLNAKAMSDPLGLYAPSRPFYDQQGEIAGYVTTIARSGSPGSYSYAANPGFENKPAMQHVSFVSALRFINWLANGQGDADTETGSYTLLGGTPTPSNALTVTRNPGAILFLPSENEWYKAAYYDALSASWFDYPTASNVAPVCSGPTASPNHANCAGPGVSRPGVGLSENVHYVSEVGAYTSSPSPYGTFDQGGNVWEFIEDIVTTSVGVGRGLRGGAFHQNSNQTGANYPNAGPAFIGPTSYWGTSGFRVAGFVAVIPEPGTALLLGAGLLGLASRRRH